MTPRTLSWCLLSRPLGPARRGIGGSRGMSRPGLRGVASGSTVRIRRAKSISISPRPEKSTSIPYPPFGSARGRGGAGGNRAGGTPVGAQRVRHCRVGRRARVSSGAPTWRQLSCPYSIAERTIDELSRRSEKGQEQTLTRGAIADQRYAPMLERKSSSCSSCSGKVAAEPSSASVSASADG